MHGERIGLFLPLVGSGLSRVMTTDIGANIGNARSTDAGSDPRRGSGEAAAAPLQLDELQRAFSSAAKVFVTLDDAQWLTKFRTHHRCVDRYRDECIFMAGDAAHIHSPAGGQGMNTGLQGAAKLAWKLGAVLRHGAPAGLLATYESERLPVARETIAFTDKLNVALVPQSAVCPAGATKTLSCDETCSTAVLKRHVFRKW